MLLELNEVLAQYLTDAIGKAKVGVVVRGVAGVDVVQVSQQVAQKTGRSLHVVAAGNTASVNDPQITFSGRIESAVAWRNQPDKAGTILVFVGTEADKLASLNFLDVVGSRDIAVYWLREQAARHLSATVPQERFWLALAREAELYPLSMIERFIRAVAGDHDKLNAIPVNLWLLGLLNDRHILDSNKTPTERLAENRDLVLEAGQLSENSRQRMSRAVSKGKVEAQQLETFKQLLNYYRRGDQDSLRYLDLEDVNTLIVTGRAMPVLVVEPTPVASTPLTAPAPASAPQPTAPVNFDTDGDDDDDDDTSPTSTRSMARDRVLSGKKLQQSLSRQLVSGNNEQGVRQLGEQLRERFADQEKSSDKSIQLKATDGFNSEELSFEVSDQLRKLYQFVGYCCTADRWGAYVEAEQRELRDAVKSVAPTQVQPFNPEQSDPDLSDVSLFSLLRSFDKVLELGSTFTKTLADLITARKELLPFLDLVLIQPEVLLIGYPEVVRTIDQYLTAYAALYSLLQVHDAALRQESQMALGIVLDQMLRLEIIYVKTGDDLKAILTPLHPFHLWRYSEIMKLLEQERSALDEDEQTQLAESLARLPHLLHFVVVSNYVATGSDTNLPHAGTIGPLPIYENHTNRYLGSDGLQAVGSTLRSWLELTPYSHYQVRLAFIDVPSIEDALRQVVSFIKNNPSTRVAVDVYYTPLREAGNALARIDYTDEKFEYLADLLASGWLEVRVEAFNGLDRVLAAMEKRPAHIAFVFDQSQFSIEQGQRNNQLLVSPLVVTYKYHYDKAMGQGTISPSADGDNSFFADYHHLVARVANLPGNLSLQLQMRPTATTKLVNQLVARKCCLWLAIADRTLLPYIPDAAVPLQEDLYGQREVGLWASNYSQTMRGLLDLLNQHNLQPDWDQVVNLVRTYGHIAATGLRSVTANRSHPDKRLNQQKGLLGTILAAEWYRRKNEGALVASLDSSMARQWLARRPEGQERADLIGLYREGDLLIVEAIEVKSTPNHAEVRASSKREGGVTTRRIEGPAVEQLINTLIILQSIFGQTEITHLLTPARREALRYQLYRECFRESHLKEQQAAWYAVLNELFKQEKSVGQPANISVECRGLVVQVIFEEANLRDKEFDDSIQTNICLLRVGAIAIQEMIGNKVQHAPIVTDLPGDGPEGGIQTTDTTPPTNDDPPATQQLNDAGSGDNDLSSANNDPLSDDVADTQPIADGQLGVSASAEPVTSPPSSTDRLAQTEQQVAAFILPTSPTQPAQAVASSTQMITPDMEQEIREVAWLFRRACADFQVKVVECDPARAVVGPSVIRYRIRLERGQRIGSLRDKLEDISYHVMRGNLMVSPLPGTSEFALDVPRRERVNVPFAEGLSQLPAITSREQLPLAIGKTPDGEYVSGRLDAMPHLLVGGTTGSGKTMFLYTLLCSLLKTHPTANDLRLLLSTSKGEDFTYFASIPHLVGGGIIDQADEAVEQISQLVASAFEERGMLLQDARCRDIAEYNRKVDQPLTPVVILVDEFADLADQFGKRSKDKEAFYANIRRVAQLGRNRGIHLVLCTQRPSADLVPTNIRNLMNTRVALRVNDAAASRMILEEPGAERLQRHGDMLYKQESSVRRLQGYYVDVERGELDDLISQFVTTTQLPRT